MKILIGIATYERPKKLIRLIESIKKNNFTDYRIVVNFDNNDNNFHEIQKKYPETVCSYMHTHFYVGGNWNDIIMWNMRNNIIRDTFDAVLPLVDDVELFPETLDKLVDDMKLLYPDTDGVIGITQVGKQKGFVPAGQCLIGKKFIERFKDVNYQVYCPEYTHWNIDQELYEYALSLGKFTLSGAKLTHYHPAFYSEEMDDVHAATRGIIMRIDKETRQKRQERNLIWGKTFERVK